MTRVWWLAAMLGALAAGGTAAAGDGVVVSDRHVGWLPAELAGARRLEAPKVWDRETVVDYMDGKADIYKTYALAQVTTTAYDLAGKRLDVMLFDMSTPAEAFGIFSNDYRGERAGVLQDSRFAHGTLRGWQGRLLLKLEGEDDTAEFRAFAKALAAVIAAKEPAGDALPPLVAQLPRQALGLTDLRFFHDVTCLDGIHYVSTKNVLALDARTSGAYGDGKLDGKPLSVMVVDYPDAAQRERGWDGYVQRVLSAQATKGPEGQMAEALDTDLWSGVVKLTGPGGEPRLGFCFEASSLPACLAGLQALREPAR